MDDYTLSLSDWIALSSALEAIHLKNISSTEYPNESRARAAKLEAKNAYAERACKVALLILDELRGRDPDEDGLSIGGNETDMISIEKFCARLSSHSQVVNVETIERAIGYLNIISSWGDISDNDDRDYNFEESEIKSILDSVVKVTITSNDFHPLHNINNEEMSQERFHGLGIMLYQLFARGENPGLHEGEEGITSQRKQIHEEENGGQSRRKQIHPSGVRESLLEKDVPVSLCRVITDLINPNEEDGTPFHSIEEVAEEVKQILDRPDIFFHSVMWLDFSDGIIGRSDEMQLIHQEAAAIQVEAGTGELRNRLVMLRGNPGAGKSYLASNLQEELAESGWLWVHTKFDRFVQNPLLTIASSFDDLLASLGEGDDEDLGILQNIETVMTRSAIVTLSEWLPIIKDIFPHIFQHVVIDDDSVSLGHQRQRRRNDITSISESAKRRLHYTFRKLISALSSPDRPLVIFFGTFEHYIISLHIMFIFSNLMIYSFLSALCTPLDDLQSADNSCLDLISSLLLDFNHIDQFGIANDAPQYFLVMGSYRENEVDSNHRLSSYLNTFERSNTLQVTNIQLNGIAKSDTNLMISEMLGLPLRLTKSLADAVQTRTLGNPLYIHAFMQSLVKEKMLVNSVFEKRWMWDIVAIQSISIQGSIAEVLTRKISYLPYETQEALKVMSTFGSQMSDEYINHLYPVEEKKQEFCDQLNSAVEESVIERIDSKYRFVHDMIQQAVYELMSIEERAECHFRNGVQILSGRFTCLECHFRDGIEMISGIDDSRFGFDHTTAAAIDQINIAKSLGVIDPSMHFQFARLNLMAGESSMEKLNFISGLSYIEHGLSFLPSASMWNPSNYDLCRSLHEAACLACYVNALPTKTNEYIAVLLENAVCLEHKLKAYYVMVKTLTSSGDNKEALKKTFEVLAELGETFPSEYTPEVIQNELSTTKRLLNNLTLESILDSPKLTDEKKLWAIKFMNNFSGPLFISKYQMAPLIACRMVQLSSQYGYCSESSFGLYGYGQAQISVFEDVDEGYRWGQIALSLLERLGGKNYLPKMRCLCSSYVRFWKEPFQATSNVLLHTQSEAMMVGDAEYASISAFFYCRQGLVCGQNLLLAEKECKAILWKMVRIICSLCSNLKQQCCKIINYFVTFCSLQVQLKQIQMCYGQVTALIFILNMNGNRNKVNIFPEIFGDKIANEDELLQVALSSGKQVNAKGILSNRFQASFWLGQFEEAAELAKKAKPTPKMSFMEIYQTFCEGLTAFQLARRPYPSADFNRWMAIGKAAMARFRLYEKCSTWNFENNLLLLEAEYHHCENEDEKAAEKYKASIKSAQDHRFVHEEALALELYGDFLRKNGRLDDSKEKYQESKACYEKWGAYAIIPRLEEKIK